MAQYPHSISQSNINSAQHICSLLYGLFKPSSVLDVGCGIGVFLDEFRKLGVKELKGLDHLIDNTLRSNYLDDSEFSDTDLNTNFTIAERYDLSLCLELAEHLKKESAEHLVDQLCKSSDLIVFSAAIPYQGGIDHINEQWPSNWIALFEAKGYQCYDVLRPMIWENDDIEWWYRQNIMIFSRSGLLQLKDLQSFEGRSIIHPGQLNKYKSQLEAIYAGKRRISFYAKTFIKSLFKRG